MIRLRRFFADRRAPRVAPSPALWRLGIVDWVGKYPILERRRTDFGIWWGNRTPRERHLLIVLAGSATIVLLVFAIYRPLADTRARAVADIQTYEVLAAQLRTAGPELARLRAINRSASPATVTSSASSFGFTPSKVEPAEGMIRVIVQDADFTKVVQWLVHIETTTHLRISQARMERRPTPGLVNAQIVLR
jgi:general secretion pathway protein M